MYNHTHRLINIKYFDFHFKNLIIFPLRIVLFKNVIYSKNNI